jgi:hypothetical protein
MAFYTYILYSGSYGKVGGELIKHRF